MGVVVRARTGLAQARQWLRHPMTPYFILIGATTLLVGVGLLEVYSASTTSNLVSGKPELGTIAKQAASAAIGVPLLVVAARLPVRAYRLMAYPLLLLTLVLLVAVLAFGQVSSGGNQNWLVLGPLTIQPSEFAKFALVLWGADLLARKEKRLASWDHLIVPLLPMSGLIIGLVMLGGDMGTSMVIAAIAFSLLWVVGAPGRLFTVLTGGAAGLATLAVLMRPSRVRRFTEFLSSSSARPDRHRLSGRAGLQRALLRRLVRRRARRQPGEVGPAARGADRLHLRHHRRGARTRRRPRRALPLRPDRLRRAADSAARRGHLRQARLGRRHRLADGADPDQPRRGARRPADRGRSAAVRLLRRLVPAALARRRRNAALLRPLAVPARAGRGARGRRRRGRRPPRSRRGSRTR